MELVHNKLEATMLLVECRTMPLVVLFIQIMILHSILHGIHKSIRLSSSSRVAMASTRETKIGNRIHIKVRT